MLGQQRPRRRARAAPAPAPRPARPGRPRPAGPSGPGPALTTPGDRAATRADAARASPPTTEVPPPNGTTATRCRPHSLEHRQHLVVGVRAARPRPGRRRRPPPAAAEGPLWTFRAAWRTRASAPVSTCSAPTTAAEFGQHCAGSVPRRQPHRRPAPAAPAVGRHDARAPAPAGRPPAGVAPARRPRRPSRTRDSSDTLWPDHGRNLNDLAERRAPGLPTWPRWPTARSSTCWWSGSASPAPGSRSTRPPGACRWPRSTRTTSPSARRAGAPSLSTADCATWPAAMSAWPWSRPASAACCWSTPRRT